MATTALFVHGTGVRKASYEFSAAQIAAGLRRINPTVKFETCLWGDECGARLGLQGASIPNFSQVPAPPPNENQMVALWELLALDPLFELRELKASNQGLEPPNLKARKEALAADVHALQDNATLAARLQGCALPVQWHEAVASVESADALIELLRTATAVDVTLRLAVARAVVASLQQRLIDDNMPSLPMELRDGLVDDCLDLLGGRDAGAIRDWISTKLVGLGLRWATAKARRERDSIFSAVAPTAGDVVLYQARGAKIRKFIEDRISACGDDVVVIAHSLGGIACVDLLVERDLPQVKLLVTAGSQAPFLYEIGALCSLPFGDKLPTHFPERWLNFYDCNDLLSYAASKVFAGRAMDHEIRSGQPFPQSHSAYWGVPDFWDRLSAELR